jgi:hypothetical protein
VTQQLQGVLQAARTLSLEEKRKLLEVLSHDVETDSLEEEAAVFWASLALDELIKSQAAPVITDVRTLAVDFWPEDEPADEFNRFIAKRRRSDRMSGA